ncbi:nucleotide glucose-1-phosphate uridylyl transferase [Leptospira perolatii]|uniref:Nucleotide glucose-1-phosphate uridylyl transferase n=1 Tax=Leptospira perolatii TaxID=2023191 RepID=A0A2M9ZPB2_9LEPT|nr:UTP--glucose-1-phosphate uridylyltransferase [Leptospira perolatii]PJZ70663.1 nucleotide glucose-1-phosphate uridylyl transferase [Leptospira perolatii]PJZ73874.1 nucleotide glucose-1-phosphate uridylyl transferase [Leptospira perolatii]
MDSLSSESDSAIQQKMLSEGLSEEFTSDFLSMVAQVRNGATGMVKWEEVGDLDPTSDEIDLETIEKNTKPNLSNLEHLAVIKLNGGLGTGMGLSGPKSLIEIKDGMSFLEVIAKQIEFLRKNYHTQVPLLFMDSFNTQEQSQKVLKQIGFTQSFPTSFLQHKVPRLRKSDFTPIQLSDSKEEWCPPGHGDIWFTLLETGILDKLLEKGVKVAFVSNGDNLGATVHPGILEYMLNEELEFCMEMTPKTLADTKGGAIFRRMISGKPGNFQLLETAQVPPEHMHEFEGTAKFRTFSTNNLWIRLDSLKRRLLAKDFSLSLIVNPKKVEGKEVLQLESAMGSAIQNFPKAKGIIVPRDRFAPVKKCEDYLVRRSDAYEIHSDFSITMSKLRKEKGLGELLVHLDDSFYKKVGDFNRRFQFIPSMVRCTSLTVRGDVFFDKPVELVGDVTIENESSEQKRISELGKSRISNEKLRFRFT